MAGERTLPGIGLTGFWDLGSPFKTGMDTNLRLLSAIVQSSVISVIDPLPASPVNGDIYLVDAGAASNANEIAVRDNGAWVYLTPAEGWRVWNRATDEFLIFDGASWSALSSGGVMSGADIVAAIDSELASTAWKAPLTAAEIEALYEGLANTNKFTDAEKTKLAGLSGPLYKGTYANTTALESAHPSPEAGSHAYVDAGLGATATLYIWDESDEAWVASSGSGGGLTGAEIKALYEAEPDTNPFDDAAQTKLAGIEDGATGDQTAAEIEALLDAYYGNTDWRTGGGAGNTVYVDPLYVFDTDPDADVTSQSASLFASKGEILTPNEDRILTAVRAYIDGGTGHTYKLVVAELVSPDPGVISAILAESAPLVVTAANAAVDFKLPEPPTLTSGTSYALIVVRTDGTATTSANITFLNASGDEIDPLGIFTHVGSVRYESTDPTVGDSTYYNAAVVKMLVSSVSATLSGIISGGGSGGGSPSFVGARRPVPLANPSNSGAWVQFSLGTATLDTDSFSGTDNFVIPAGVSRVRLRAFIRSVSSDTASNQWAFYKNGLAISPTDGGVLGEIDSGAYDNGGMSIISGVLDVVEGDTFDLRGFFNSTSNDYQGWIEIEVVEGTLLGSGGGSGGGGGGASAFLDLTDSPAAYTGQGGKAVAVKAAEDGVEFVDFPEGGGGLADGAAAAAALDTHLGSDTWRQGLATPANLNALSDVAVDTSAFTENDHGAALTWDFATGLWVAGKSGFNTLRLGGGMEVIYENADVSALGQITLSELTHGIDKYDEIVIQFVNITGRGRVRVSSNNGSSFLPQAYWRITSDTAGDGTVTDASESGPLAGGITANLAGTYGLATVKYHSDPSAHTVITAQGGSVNDTDGSMSQEGFTVSTAIANYISIFSADAATFGSGSIRVLGVKKSRQPLEYHGALAGAPSVSGTVTMGHTLGCKFRSGTIGKATVDVAPGADMTVEIRDGTGTVIATGVILAAATECDLAAATTQIVTDRVVGAVVTTGTSAQAIDFIVRGEIA